MKKRFMGWIMLAVLVGAMLAGAYLIVERNHPGSEETPAELLH